MSNLFTFGPSEAFIRDCPSDVHAPFLYLGEEVSTSIKLFTKIGTENTSNRAAFTLSRSATQTRVFSRRQTQRSFVIREHLRRRIRDTSSGQSTNAVERVLLPAYFSNRVRRRSFRRRRRRKVIIYTMTISLTSEMEDARKSSNHFRACPFAKKASSNARKQPD